MNIADMKLGMRVVTVEPIDIFPYAILPAGLAGVVNRVGVFGDKPPAVSVKLDDPLTEELGDWYNELYVYAESDTASYAVIDAYFEPLTA